MVKSCKETGVPTLRCVVAYSITCCLEHTVDRKRYNFAWSCTPGKQRGCKKPCKLFSIQSHYVDAWELINKIRKRRKLFNEMSMGIYLVVNGIRHISAKSLGLPTVLGKYLCLRKGRFAARGRIRKPRGPWLCMPAKRGICLSTFYLRKNGLPKFINRCQDSIYSHEFVPKLKK